MTTIPSPEDVADRFTPQLVYLASQGGSLTFTALIDREYYTLERVHPDFVRVADDATLQTLGTIAEPPLTERMRELERELESSQRTAKWYNARCEKFIINALLAGRITFGKLFREYMIDIGQADAVPTDRVYYDAMKTFTGIWHQLSNAKYILAG